MGLFGITGKDDSSPFIKKYNGQQWRVQIRLINIKRGVNVTLVTTSINQLIIKNSIECHSPTIELTYFDLGLTLNKIIDSNNLLLQVSMTQPSPNTEDKYWDTEGLLDINLLFDVDKVTTLFKKNTNTMYRFNGTHHNQTLLLKNINIATVEDLKDTKNTKESPLVIINKLLSKVNYPIDQIVNDTTQRVHFISSQTQNVDETIDQLLRKAVSIYDPPTYFVHNLKTGKAMLINSKKLEKRLYNLANKLNVYGNPDSKQLNYDLISQISDVTNGSFNTGVLAQRYISKFTFRHFDQNTRKWTTTTFDYNIINNIFNRDVLTKDSLYESVFPIKNKVDRNDMKYDFPNENEQKMYLFLRELQLGTNSIQFKVTGNITRDAGQYVMLTCSNQSQIPKYEGLWHIYSCEHKWSGKIYTNELVCYRTYAKKPVWSEKNETKNNGA